MTKFKCIIVDDEPIAIRVIKNHLSRFEEFEVLMESSNAIDTMKYLRQNRVDLLFLDIEMPTLTGLEMLKTLDYYPDVIFTTAHRSYAVDAFDVHAFDYLLKPISFERFAKSINHFIRQKGDSLQLNTKEEAVESLVVKVDKKNVKVLLSEIIYIESLSDYVVIHMHNQKIVTKERITQLQSKLGMFGFMRVHRSFIVNVKKVTAWYGNTLEIINVKIPVGRNYKNEVNTRFKQ